MINGVIVHMEPDSGADISVMDERQYNALKHISYEDIALKTSRTKLSILQNELQVTGEFTATARNQTRGAETTFIVVKGKIISPPLLGRNGLFESGLLYIRPDESLKETKELRKINALAIKSTLNSKVSSDVEVNSDVDKILKQNDQVFQGTGKIFHVRNNEDFLDESRRYTGPVAQKPRSVPYYLQEPLQKWLDECIKEDIFEKVDSGDPITWCSPLVVQPNPRYKNISKDNLGPRMIQASVDLRVPNKYMERNRILQ